MRKISEKPVNGKSDDFIKIDAEFVRSHMRHLGRDAIVSYLGMAFHRDYNDSTKPIWPAHARLAILGGYQTNSPMEKGIHDLKQQGLVESKRRGPHSNQYTLLPVTPYRKDPSKNTVQAAKDPSNFRGLDPSKNLQKTHPKIGTEREPFNESHVFNSSLRSELKTERETGNESQIVNLSLRSRLTSAASKKELSSASRTIFNSPFQANSNSKPNATALRAPLTRSQERSAPPAPSPARWQAAGSSLADQQRWKQLEAARRATAHAGAQARLEALRQSNGKSNGLPVKAKTETDAFSQMLARMVGGQR